MENNVICHLSGLVNTLLGSQIGATNGSDFTNTPIKLKLCAQRFFKVGNLMKLIIYDEIENFPYLWAIFVILGPKKMGQNCDNFQNFTKGFLGEEFEGQNNCQGN